MKKFVYIVCMSLLASVGLGFSQTNLYPPQLAAFCDAKEAQEQQLARELHLRVPAEVNDFFKSVHQGDLLSFSNTVDRLGAQLYAGYSSFTNGLPAWLPFWQPMTEVESAYEIFAQGGTKYPMAFGEDIISSIPAGSIYFGGSDAGRMLVTALCESYTEGKPFFTLTQNALSDGRYLDYLRRMYGARINLPTTNDVEAALADYKEDALRRLKHDQEFPGEPRQLKQGENVRLLNGILQMNNAVSVMAVHARLVKSIMDRNPGREFYIEESYPLETLYPYQTPHGLIFKLSHEVLPVLPAADIESDRAFWSKQCAGMLGDWLKPETSVSNVCAFVETVYRQKDLSHFGGDKGFLTNDFAPKAFSKLRVSIAGLYQWRLMKGTGTDNAARLNQEADYAFRQAYALCPTSPEVLFRYDNFLTAQHRFDDAILIVRTKKWTPKFGP